jgi:hypothetical protein
VVVIKEFAAKFQIELAAKLFHPLQNAGALQFCVFFVIKADFEHFPHPEKE